MACDRIPLSLAFPILATVVVVDEAEAAAADAAPGFSGTAGCYYDPAPTGGDAGGAPYYDYCSGVQALEDLVPQNAEQIPIDGVLVLQAPFLGPWDQAIPDRATVTVTADGLPFPGALELTPLPGTLIWRPAAAWNPDALHEFTAEIANPGAPAQCAAAALTVEFAITVADQPLGELIAPTLTGEEQLVVNPIISLDTLACCPDVSPMLLIGQCGAGDSVDFDPAQCTPLSAEGSLLVALQGSEAALGATAGQVYYELMVDGASDGLSIVPTYNVALQKPFCATLTARSLVSDVSITGPMACFGGDVADELGVHPIDPPDSFTCSLRQCESNGQTWDLESCTPLDPNHPNEPEDEPGKGCSCAAEPAHGLTALALTGLVGLTLRRRRRR
jgi:MYXO-CTERM domain-containing protein